MNGARASLAGARRRLAAGMPADVGALGALVVLAAFCCLLGTLFPISEGAPVELGRVLTPIGFAVGAALLIGGARVARWGLHAAVAFMTAATSLLLSQSTTNGGLMMTAWCYAWMAVYVGVFFDRGAIAAHLGAMTAGCVGAVAVAGLPGTLVEAAIMTVTLWTAGIALGAISARLRAQADRDHLTGLLNRHGFAKAADRERALANRTGYPLTLALADLDDFKRVNDAHGHAAGDRLLTELAAAWTRSLRPGDLIARFGGDEFVVLFPATGAEEARSALTRLRGAHAAGWSAGVVAWDPGEPLQACLARADALLYAAKGDRLERASVG